MLLVGSRFIQDYNFAMFSLCFFLNLSFINSSIQQPNIPWDPEVALMFLNNTVILKKVVLVVVVTVL